jgi:hypothetical protein
MGFNTTVVVMNDALGDIENDPEFGKRLASAIHSVGSQKVDVSAHHSNGRSISGNAATVIETHHCGDTALVAVGGNHGTVIAWAGDVPHHKTEGQLKLLQALAEKLGYHLVEKGAVK